MGVWSTIGSLAKNTVKIGGGYAVGNIVKDAVSQSENEAISGMAGVAGIAGAYILPAAGSKLFGFVGDKLSGNDADTENKKGGFWKSIGKAAALGAGTLFVGDQAMKWYNDHAAAISNIHTPAEGEYLQTGGTETSPPVSRTGYEALSGIQTETEADSMEIQSY